MLVKTVSAYFVADLSDALPCHFCCNLSILFVFPVFWLFVVRRNARCPSLKCITHSIHVAPVRPFASAHVMQTKIDHHLLLNAASVSSTLALTEKLQWLRTTLTHRACPTVAVRLYWNAIALAFQTRHLISRMDSASTMMVRQWMLLLVIHPPFYTDTQFYPHDVWQRIAFTIHFHTELWWTFFVYVELVHVLTAVARSIPMQICIFSITFNSKHYDEFNSIKLNQTNRKLYKMSFCRKKNWHFNFAVISVRRGRRQSIADGICASTFISSSIEQ